MAEMETAQARAGQSAAEFERDVVATVAINEAVHRAVAEDATTDAKMRANQAESRERSMATSASLSRQDASNERAAASNAIFSATLIGVVAVCLVLVIGYFAGWAPGQRTNASTSTFIRTHKTTETTATPPNVIVEQPNVNVKVVVPESNPQPEEKASPTETPPVSDPVQSSEGDKAPETQSG